MDTDLEGIKQAILATYTREDIRLHHVNPLPLPSKEILEGLLEDLLALLYPGYFGSTVTDIPDVTEQVNKRVDLIFEKLRQQIYLSFRHFCDRPGSECSHCDEAARGTTRTFLERIPRLREFLHNDVEAAYDGDPAAKSIDEIIFSYPGVYAITVYRIAHELEQLHVPLLPRILTEVAHSRTGIDVHPGAKIGDHFFIDHGTGVVIGETTEIGNRVRLYQGVTLGAVNFPRDAEGRLIRGQKRHPTVEDDCIIYASATVLGGETVVGRGSIIGSNVRLMESVPSGSKVMAEPARHTITPRLTLDKKAAAGKKK
ncbi:MAG: serine acetyltransferase [Acidobacteriia bacterium]|nr:serine acetyltransferase [Terriglobia bacterium]